jgi:hypothetical protein
MGDSATFTPRLKKKYAAACAENCGQKTAEKYITVSGSKNKFTERNLDLTSGHVFDDIVSKNLPVKKGQARSPEYKLEAFLVKKAIEHQLELGENRGWPLLSINNNWFLLDAERNISSLDLQKDDPEIKKARRLDILAYDKTNNSLIVLELKAEKTAAAIKKANQELKLYTGALKRFLTDIQDIYNIGPITRVKGYQVLPEGSAIGEVHPDWGVITYKDENLASLNNNRDAHYLEFKLIR